MRGNKGELSAHRESLRTILRACGGDVADGGSAHRSFRRSKFEMGVGQGDVPARYHLEGERGGEKVARMW